MKNLIMAVLLMGATQAWAEFKSEDEVSMVSTGGNTEVKTYIGKSQNTYDWSKNTMTLTGHYTYGEAAKKRNLERWDVLLKYDRKLKKTFSLFVSELVEANRFAGIERRFNTDAGVKYQFVKTEKNTSFVEAGYRYTIEKQYLSTKPDLKDSKARVYVQTDHIFNKSVSGKLWVEYIPNFTNSDDYLINFEPSVSVVLTDILSLKVSYLWNYDNQQVPGNGKHDYTYTTGLIAKF